MEVQPQPAGPTGPPLDPEPRWGLGDFALGLGAGLVLSSLVAASWVAATGDPDLGTAGQSASQIGLWTGMVGATVAASRRKGRGTLAADFGLRARWADLGLGAAVAVAVQLFVLPLVGVLLRPLLGRPEVSGPVQEMLDRAAGPALVLLVASVVVGAPFVEELFFRGLLLRSLRRRMPPAAAVGLSSVIFGLAHASALPGPAVALVMISLSVFGAVLGVLALKTGRLGPSIVTHSVFNLFTLVFLALAG